MLDLEVRGALPGDTAAMRALTADVWEGTDYVPFVWNEWLRDPNGLVQVATLNGALVGLQHVGLQPDGTAWVEGIRVLESLRGQGVGHRLLEAAVKWASAADSRVMRLSTTSNNPASARIAERIGMRVVAKFASVRAEAADSPVSSGIRVLSPADFDDACQFLAHLLVGQVADVYTEGWTAYSLTEERLRVLLATHSVIASGGPGIESVAIATSASARPSLRLGLLVGSAEGMYQCATWLRSQAGRTGTSPVRALVRGDAAAAAVARAGYASRHGFSMLLHQMQVPEGPINSGS